VPGNNEYLFRVINGVSDGNVTLFLTGSGALTENKTMAPGEVALWEKLQFGESYKLSIDPSGNPLLADINIPTSPDIQAITGGIYGSASSPAFRMIGGDGGKDEFERPTDNRPKIRAIRMDGSAAKVSLVRKIEGETPIVFDVPAGDGASNYTGGITIHR
jgi:hypothetical protein